VLADLKVRPTIAGQQAAEKRSLNAEYQMANLKFSIVAGIWH
jgi:hypothetical protein